MAEPPLGQAVTPPVFKAATANSDTPPIVGRFSVAENATFVSDEKTSVVPPIPTDFDDETLPATNVKRTRGKLEKNLCDTYETIGTMIGFVDPYCGRAIVGNSETMAQTMAEWAAEDPKVRAALERMMVVGTFGKVLAAHTPVLMAIGMHHVPAVRNMFAGHAHDETADAPIVTDDYGNPVSDVAA